MKIPRFLLTAALLSVFAMADTPPPGTVKAKTEDGAGTPITSTNVSGKQGLDVNVITTTGTSTVNQGTSNGGSSPWYIQGNTNAVQSGTWNVGVTNFPSTFGVTQSTSPWLTSRNWTLNSGTDSVSIAGSITASNPSVGPTGSPPPSQATLVGGTDGTDLRAMKVSSTGVLSVDGSAVTQPVSGSVSVSNFPGVQAVSQSGNWTVQQGTPPWSTNLTQISGASPSVTNYLPSRITNGTSYVDPTQIRALSSGTDSVSVGNFPATQVVSGTVTANAGTGTFTVGQATGANLHADIDNFPATQPVSGTVTANQGGTWNVNAVQSGTWTVQQGGAPWAVSQSGTWNINNISGTISLPTGAATAANQSTANTTLAAIQANQTNGTQETQVTTNVLPADIDVSGSITTSCTTPTTSCPAGSFLSTTIHGAASSRFALTGTFSGSFQVDCSLDGTNWSTLRFAGGTNAAYTTDAVTSTGIYRIFRMAACQMVRVRGFNFTSGTATVQMNISGPPDVVESVFSGREASYAIVNNYSSTNVTTSAYLTLISSTSSSLHQEDIFDSSGQTFYLSYAATCGALSSSSNTILVYPGGNGKVDWAIPSGQCVGIEAQSANATVGVLNATFFQ